MVSGFQPVAFVDLWGMSFPLLWQAGYGHSGPTCNHEAQQGSVKLNFLRGLRLLTSTEESVNLHHSRLSICNAHTHTHRKKKGEKGHWHSSSPDLNLIRQNGWNVSKQFYISHPLHRLQSNTGLSDWIVRGITVILCANRSGRSDATQPDWQKTNCYHHFIVRTDGAAMARPAAAVELSLVQDQSYSSSWKASFPPPPLSAVQGYLPCWSQPKAAIGAACSLGRDRSELQYVSRCPPTLSDDCVLKIPFPSSKAWTLHPICMLNASATASSQNSHSAGLSRSFGRAFFLFCFSTYALDVCTTGSEMWLYAKCTSIAGCITGLNLFLRFGLDAKLHAASWIPPSGFACTAGAHLGLDSGCS